MSGKSAKKARRGRGVIGTDWTALDAVMARDDVAWLYSSAQSVSGTRWEAATGLSLGTQMARVAHEGFEWLRKKKPAEAAALFRSQSAEIASARHALKLVDDTAKHAEGVLADFRRLQFANGRSRADTETFAAVMLDGRLFTTTRVAAFQGIADIDEVRSPVVQSQSLSLATEMGGLMVEVVRRFGHAIAPPLPHLPPAGAAPGYFQYHYEDFHSARLEPDFPNELKDLISAVESSVNGARTVFAAYGTAFPGPVFRAQFIILTHGLTTMQYVADMWGHLSNRPGMRALAELLEKPSSRRMLGMSALRNRSMHYGVPSALTGLGPRMPMYGLVESTTGTAFEELKAELDSMLDEMSALFRDWKTFG